MILYRRYAGSGSPDDHDVWRFRARLSQMGTEHLAHEFTSTSWRFGEATYTVDLAAAKQLSPGDILVERYPFCLQDDPLIGEPVWSNGYAWLPAAYGTQTDWDHPNRQAVSFLRDVGASRWPSLIECIQHRYLEDLARADHLTPELKGAIQGLLQAQYFDGKATIDQHLMWMDPELLVATEHQRLFQLHVPVKQDSFLRLFIKETLDPELGHQLGIFRSRQDADADRDPYVAFPTVGNWLRRLEHEIEIGLQGAWLRG